MVNELGDQIPGNGGSPGLFDFVHAFEVIFTLYFQGFSADLKNSLDRHNNSGIGSPTLEK